MKNDLDHLVDVLEKGALGLDEEISNARSVGSISQMMLLTALQANLLHSIRRYRADVGSMILDTNGDDQDDCVEST